MEYLTINIVKNQSNLNLYYKVLLLKLVYKTDNWFQNICF